MEGAQNHWTVRRVTRLGFLTAVGTALFVLESLVPLPLPFLKIGFANISTLLALLVSGPIDALAVVTLRIIAGSLLTGSFLGPSFVLAFSAGLVAAVVMNVLRTLAPSILGPVGLSLAGSSAHVLTQLAVVGFVYVRNGALFHLLPLLLLTALVGGLAVGLITSRLLPVLASSGLSGSERPAQPSARIQPWDKVAIALLAASIVCAFVFSPTSAGSTVLIEVDGRTVGKMSLLQDQELSVQGAKGKLVVEIKHGEVRVREADCPNKICVRTGWRRNGGDAIVCVPNKTVVRIMSEHDGAVQGTTG